MLGSQTVSDKCHCQKGKMCIRDRRLGGYAAYGPILQGLNAPINDLSRGCNADEVYKMSLITACQS